MQDLLIDMQYIGNRQLFSAFANLTLGYSQNIERDILTLLEFINYSSAEKQLLTSMAKA
jgi:hypothetical protein